MSNDGTTSEASSVKASAERRGILAILRDSLLLFAIYVYTFGLISEYSYLWPFNLQLTASDVAPQQLIVITFERLSPLLYPAVYASVYIQAVAIFVFMLFELRTQIGGYLNKLFPWVTFVKPASWSALRATSRRFALLLWFGVTVLLIQRAIISGQAQALSDTANGCANGDTTRLETHLHFKPEALRSLDKSFTDFNKRGRLRIIEQDDQFLYVYKTGRIGGITNGDTLAIRKDAVYGWSVRLEPMDDARRGDLCGP